MEEQPGARQLTRERRFRFVQVNQEESKPLKWI